MYLAHLVLAAALAPGDAALVVEPARVVLGGTAREQQLLVADVASGRLTAFHAAAAFASSNPKVATVGADGIVRPVADGETVVTVTVGKRSATVPVTVAGTAAAPAWSFRNHVVPLMTRAGCNSGACHGALAGKGGFKLSLRGFDPDSDHFAMTRQATARRIDAAAPAQSLILRKPSRELPHGGGRRVPDDSANYEVLLGWIKAGSPGPADGDAELTRLDVFPKAALLKPKDTFRVAVRATYSDGTTADVTKWARLGSTGDLVAAVDEDGKVTVASPGEAAITVNYGTKVATLTVTVPFPTAVADAAFVRPPGGNFIDDHVLAKLKELRIPPAGPCTDAEFVRRAHLDACGILPTPEEVAAFLADAQPDKRAKLVDALLARPAYVDYWSHKWSDLLLVSSRKLPQPAVWAFYRRVRQAVAENEPWDKFARSVLTASGGTLTNGAANYFVLHKEVTDIIESTAVTFLGTSINCARCHNHPLEKWTQDQYWATANLFARVGLKNGDRPGEVFVTTLPTGDAFHLRRGTAMPPAPLDGKPMPADAATDRREFFADWLTAPKNPFFAKAVVNRVWKNFMGRGLVEAEDDLRDTNPPSNPELMDALAAEFVAKGYDVKHLIRLVMNSAAYQRSAVATPGNAADDRFYSRYFVRRLSAEVILDAYSDVSGVATPFDTLAIGASGGTAKNNNYPPGTRALQLPDSMLVSDFLDSFGRAERGQTCSCERTADSSVGQALHLNNGATLNAKLRDPKSRVASWLAAGVTDSAIVSDLFARALGRAPTAAEAKKLTAELAAAGPAGRREAVEDLVWAVLTGPEFLFNR